MIKPPCKSQPAAGESRSKYMACLIAGWMMLGISISFAVDTPTSSDLPDMTELRALVKEKRFAEAAPRLRELSTRVQHADVFNLLAFSLRNLGDYESAAKYYREALYYDPDHKSALEYQGEMFVKLGDLRRARDNVLKLTLICPNGCEELDDLKEAITEAESKLQSK